MESVYKSIIPPATSERIRFVVWFTNAAEQVFRAEKAYHIRPCKGENIKTAEAMLNEDYPSAIIYQRIQ